MIYIWVDPWYTVTNGRTIKNGNSNLYLHGKSSMSSANPNIIVPKIVTNTARWVIRISVLLQNFSITTKIIPTIQKETAAANPIHSGISFYPALVPFLLRSNPWIFFLDINYATFGIRDLVRYHDARAATEKRLSFYRDNWERATIDERIAVAVVNVREFIYTFKLLLYLMIIIQFYCLRIFIMRDCWWDEWKDLWSV